MWRPEAGKSWGTEKVETGGAGKARGRAGSGWLAPEVARSAEAVDFCGDGGEKNGGGDGEDGEVRVALGEGSGCVAGEFKEPIVGDVR